MRVVILALTVPLLFLSGCGASKVEKQCKKRVELQGEALSAKGLKACMQQQRALAKKDPKQAACLSKCVMGSSSKVDLTKCSSACVASEKTAAR